ncbi:MAG TPA: glycosyl hydrolase [Cyclobacteriaceae bacterium]|nr:glycosyl hydrolase [Cyclobacteriaceae bacterium]
MIRLLFLTVVIASLHTTVWSQRKSKAAPPATSSAVDVSNFAALQWRNIGPYRGGRANTISGVIGDPMTYYTGYTGGGVWKTVDGGYNWTNVSDGFFGVGSIGDIAVSESDPNVVYVGTGEHAVRGVMTSFGDGVYKSTDAGKTWKNIGLEKTRHISDVIIHPNNPDVVLIGAQGAVHGPSADRGVYKSVDGGATWKKTLYVDENTGVSSLSMDMSNPRILYAATWQHRRYPWKVESGGPGSAIWKSTDSGETWTKLTNGLPAEMGKIGLSVSRANPERVYALIEAEKVKSGLYRSDDAGKTWSLQSNDQIITARSWYYMEVFADPQNADVVYALNAPIMRSIDGGKTWINLNDVHGDCHELWINPQDNKNIALAQDGGGCISFSWGKVWSSLNNQPTSQFYRVSADRQVPYWLYAGQQDNLSVAIPSRTNTYGILTKHWFDGPGCESAAIAFDDPYNPTVLYGDCYQGTISRQEMSTKELKDIMEYPSTNLGEQPRNMKYRFNWNAPLINSPHDPKIMYHAGNVLFRTNNGGQSWDPISPDLTRNDESKQRQGGGPFTNEGAGGENYNTIYYVAESPLEKGVIYTGSDCGLMHVTRDDGKTWTNITPPDMPETMIHSIEVSPHDKGTVYFAATRYKFNDYSNMSYKSTDYGKTWTKIGNGVAKDDFIRVIREDQKTKGLLYAGAERGFYISFDQGASFQKFQSNLPVVPITDLIIRDNDLAASTAGRSFWILDDLSALQQSKGDFGSAKVKLVQPNPTYRIFGAPGFYLITEHGVGKNPPEGVQLDYYLSEKVTDKTITLEILDGQGQVIRNYTNQEAKDFKSYPGGPSKPTPIPANKGLNRFVWDFRTNGLPDVPGVFVFEGNYNGHRVAPGKYKAKMTYDGVTSEADIEIMADPRLKVSNVAWTEQQALIKKAEDAIVEVHDAVNKIRKVDQQLKTIGDQYKSNDNATDLVKAAEELSKKIKEWQSNILEERQKGFQDALNWPSKLNSEFFLIRNNLDTHDPRVPEGYKTRFDDLQKSWSGYRQQYNQIINQEVKKLNEIFQSKDIPLLNVETSDSMLNN